MDSNELDFYSLLTKYSLMEEYGFSSGLISRLFRKVLPIVPDKDTAAYLLLSKDNSVDDLLSRMDWSGMSNSPIAQQLDLSIQALCAKVLAFGLDNNIKAKYTFLELESRPFENLLEQINHLARYGKEETRELIASLEAIELLIIKLRKNKNKIGTNFHLTLTTRRMLDYIQRIRELLDLRLHINSKEHWKRIFTDYMEYSSYKDSIRHHIRRHSDLVALEIVEHTSNKGEKYIAESRKEYWGFFYKSLLGGGIIAVFALLKIIISSYQFTPGMNALLYSINYAGCFVLVKQLGGIIATKQPAMTASTIAENIDQRNKLQIDSIKSIVLLVRKVFRSQFISVVGNFLMALALASGIMYLLHWWGSSNWPKIVKPEYLIKKVVPTAELVAFAAIAGFYLALSGLISGYIDNKMVASKVAHRIRNSELFLRSDRLAVFAEKKAGPLVGNISLGFFLGSTFLLSNVLPFPVDIRHIAFSSANVGYSILNHDFEVNTILLALAGALLIGFVNFIVSFSITLYLALKSRGADIRLVPKLLFHILKDMLRNPLYYYVSIEKEGVSTRKV